MKKVGQTGSVGKLGEEPKYMDIIELVYLQLVLNENDRMETIFQVNEGLADIYPDIVEDFVHKVTRAIDEFALSINAREEEEDECIQ